MSMQMPFLDSYQLETSIPFVFLKINFDSSVSSGASNNQARFVIHNPDSILMVAPETVIMKVYDLICRVKGRLLHHHDPQNIQYIVPVRESNIVINRISSLADLGDDSILFCWIRG